MFFLSDDLELALQQMRWVKKYANISTPLKLHPDTQGRASVIGPCSSSCTNQGIRSSCCQDWQSSIDNCQGYERSGTYLFLPFLNFKAPWVLCVLIIDAGNNCCNGCWIAILSRLVREYEKEIPTGLANNPRCVKSMPTIMVGMVFSHSLSFLSKV